MISIQIFIIIFSYSSIQADCDILFVFMCSIFVWRWCGSFSGMITMSIVLNLYKNIESSLCVIFIEVLLKFWCLACLSPVLGIWRGYLRHLIAHHNNMTNLPSRLCNLFTQKNDPYLLPQYFLRSSQIPILALWIVFFSP